VHNGQFVTLVPDCSYHLIVLIKAVRVDSAGRLMALIYRHPGMNSVKLFHAFTVRFPVLCAVSMNNSSIIFPLRVVGLTGANNFNAHAIDCFVIDSKEPQQLRQRLLQDHQVQVVENWVVLGECTIMALLFKPLLIILQGRVALHGECSIGNNGLREACVEI